MGSPPESVQTCVKMTSTAGDADGNISRVEYSIREGKTAENIVNFAHTENIDLLVISTHGSGGLSRWNISSVTQKVINLIYLPVLIVRAYDQPETETARIFYRRILLPIDSSRRAECALAAGIALARGELSMGMPTEGITFHSTHRACRRSHANKTHPRRRDQTTGNTHPRSLPCRHPAAL